MGLLEDINKTLERIPVWKKLVALPPQLEKLEARVAALEAKLGPKQGSECPICGELAMKVIASAPHPEFDWAGAKRDTVKCSSCGHQEFQDRDLR